jgi:hypothetical protein
MGRSKTDLPNLPTSLPYVGRWGCGEVGRGEMGWTSPNPPTDWICA